MFFFENICLEESFLDMRKTVCTMDEWKAVMDPRDVVRVSEIIQEIVEVKEGSYILNHRVRNRRGEMVWINNRCRRCVLSVISTKAHTITVC